MLRPRPSPKTPFAKNLTTLLGTGQGLALAIVATLPEGRDGGSELASFVVRPEDASLFRIRARGYSREDVRRLVQQVLGVDAPLSFRERLFRVTGGNVRHVRWIVGHVAERGAPPGSHVQSVSTRVCPGAPWAWTTA